MLSPIHAFHIERLEGIEDGDEKNPMDIRFRFDPEGIICF